MRAPSAGVSPRRLRCAAISPRRARSILGKVKDKGGEDGAGKLDYALDGTGQPYTTLSYANGPGHTGSSNQQPAGAKRYPHNPSSFEPANGRPNLREVDTEHPDYMQEALVPMKSESHGGEDVGIWARGPGSKAIRGTLEQNAIDPFISYGAGLRRRRYPKQWRRQRVILVRVKHN